MRDAELQILVMHEACPQIAYSLAEEVRCFVSKVNKGQEKVRCGDKRGSRHGGDFLGEVI